jgi:hypothetical protein
MFCYILGNSRKHLKLENQRLWKLILWTSGSWVTMFHSTLRRRQYAFFLFSKSWHSPNRWHNVLTQNTITSRFKSISLQLSSTLQTNFTSTCICISPRPNQLQWVTWHVDGGATRRRAYELQVTMVLKSERLLYNLQRERHPAQEWVNGRIFLGQVAESTNICAGRHCMYVCIYIYIYIYIYIFSPVFIYIATEDNHKVSEIKQIKNGGNYKKYDIYKHTWYSVA